MPVTLPVAGLTVAIPAGVHDQVPPAVAVALDRVVLAPTQTLSGPVIAPPEGAANTVTVTVLVPKEVAYEITADPAVTPVTTPEVDTVATDVLPLLHVPPEVAHASAVVALVQTVSVPVIGAFSSVMLTLVLFHLSPASSVPLKLMALTTPYSLTVPAPVLGAVHGIDST